MHCMRHQEDADVCIVISQRLFGSSKLSCFFFLKKSFFDGLNRYHSRVIEIESPITHMHKNKLTMIRIWFEQKLRKETTMYTQKYSPKDTSDSLENRAACCVLDDMIVVDDSNGRLATVDHLVIVDRPMDSILCGIVDNKICGMKEVYRSSDDGKLHISAKDANRVGHITNDHRLSIEERCKIFNEVYCKMNEHDWCFIREVIV